MVECVWGVCVVKRATFFRFGVEKLDLVVFSQRSVIVEKMVECFLGLGRFLCDCREGGGVCLGCEKILFGLRVCERRG
jgi:hypothetical protein